MNLFIDAIREMVYPGLVCSQLTLVENDPGSRVPPIRFHQSAQRPLLLQLDQKLELSCEHHHPIQLEANRRMFPLLNPQTPGVTRCCDYVLFSQATNITDGDLTVLLCEIKTKHTGGALKQIKNTSILVDHLLQLVEYHQSKKRPKIVWRGIVFSEGSGIQGGTTRLPCRYQKVEFPVGMGEYVSLKVDNYKLDYLCG